MEENKNINTQKTTQPQAENEKKIKTREGSGYLKQLYSTARSTASTTHSNLSRTTFMVNFVPVDKVDASELQVRSFFDDNEIKALAHSIKEHGVLQPILVVQNGDRYKVIAGERRLRATKLAGLDRIPARVMSSDDKTIHEVALRENLDRVDLHPIEEGEGYVALLESKAYTSHDAIAKAFLKPKSRITECIGFTKLPTESKALLIEKSIKQRSLLRKLINSPVEEHAALVDLCVAQEAKGEFGIGGAKLAVKKVTSPTPATEKKEIKRFEFTCDKKGIQVPGFKWKAGEGNERLTDYIEAIGRMIKETKEQHLK